MARPQRILQIMRAPVGGLFRHVADLTRELADRGHAVGLVVDSTSGDAQTEQKLAALSDAVALGIHRFPIPRLLGPADISTPFKISRLAADLDISILHGHGAKGGFGARLARFGSRTRKAVYTPHGGALHFNPRSPSGALFMAIERGLLGVTDALVFESAYAKETFAKHVGGAKRHQVVIHNGLAAAEFEPIIPNADAADFVFVGELRMLKGIDLIIEALAPLVGPNGLPATLIMAGDGPDRGWLEQAIADRNLQQRVTLAGVKPAREMFSRGRCVLVPSRAESLPYIVLEASAAARPVIATRVGGIPEIFGPTSDRLVPADDAAALSSAMAAFLNNPDAASADASARLDFIRNRFSVGMMVDDIEALYANLGR
ncbi:glycosyltransferase [Pelagibacterium luteolum]|uniref:Glycosyltransferase involved in cell wall bisynthesis n=1 Tax=Pelagibacterium luteolum TaxID=440168 RepID=A0A1G7WF11_9HYPH|nr:glycosyltransferase [Pelagibacterium luteolum]SDG70536.1 Glycosyltransferase involved in cell wall bisynthesis [Pelagibacterium luteolum]